MRTLQEWMGHRDFMIYADYQSGEQGGGRRVPTRAALPGLDCGGASVGGLGRRSPEVGTPRGVWAFQAREAYGLRMVTGRAWVAAGR